MIVYRVHVRKKSAALTAIAWVSLVCFPLPIAQARHGCVSGKNQPCVDDPTIRESGAVRDGEMNKDEDVRQLTQTLAGAYGNALRRDAPGKNLEAEDVLLERASIRLASLLVHEIAQTSCGGLRQTLARAPSGTCILDDESVGLKSLTDVLSYAASRLENQGRLAGRSNSRPAPSRIRTGSLEHLYRVVFVLSRIYLDRSQGGSDATGARQQVSLARKSLEAERDLCAGESQEYALRLRELTELDEAIRELPVQR